MQHFSFTKRTPQRRRAVHNAAGGAAARCAARGARIVAMLFPFGWPARLQTTCPAGEPFVFLSAAGGAHVVAVTPSLVELWSAGQQRVRLGCALLPPEDAARYGVHAAAVWCPEQGRLAVLVREARGRSGAAASQG